MVVYGQFLSRSELDSISGSDSKNSASCSFLLVSSPQAQRAGRDQVIHPAPPAQRQSWCRPVASCIVITS